MAELDLYLQHHWAAAAGGQDLAQRVAGSHRGSDVEARLQAVARELVEDREALGRLMGRLDIRPGRVGPLAFRLAERAGRLKPNGHLVHRSPVSDVLELEALQAAVSSKRACWDVLLVLAAHVSDLPEAEVQRLRDRANGQLDTLADVHRVLAARRLATSG